MELIKSKITFFFIIPFVIYISLLTVMPLMEPDEARYSAIPSAMNYSGDYVTPHLKGTVYLEKPPLCYWATALFFKIFGENEFSARLFSALCAWGCILLVYAIGTFYHDAETGFYAAAVLTTSLFHFILGRMNLLDMPLTFFVSLAVWCGYRYFFGGGEGKTRLYLFYLFCALAFLTKGLIGIVFPSAIIVLWLLLSKRWRDILNIFSPVGIIIFFAITGPWLILVQRANKDFLWFFFVQEHFLRYTTSEHGKSEPFYFYLPIIIAGTLPWCAFLFKAIKESGTKVASLFVSTERLFLLTWMGFILLFFSVSSSKLVPYIAPVFLPLAVFMGHIFRIHDNYATALDKRQVAGILHSLPVVLQSLLFIALLLVPSFLKERAIPLHVWWPWVTFPILLQIVMVFLPDLIRKKWGRGYYTTVYALSFLFMGSLLFPLSQFLTPYKSAYPLIKTIEDHVPADKELYQYGMSLYGIDFYSKRRTPIVEDIGELRPGVEKLPLEEKYHYFLSYDMFYARYNHKNDIYCAAKYKNIEKLKKEIPLLRIVWSNGYYYLLHLQKSE